MAKTKIVINRAGVRKLLKEPGVLHDLERRANAVAAAAGPGHVVDSGMGRNRARAAVITRHVNAQRAEATGRRLTRSIDAAR